jgi:hypothetical protein
VGTHAMVGAALTTYGTGRHCQTARVRQAVMSNLVADPAFLLVAWDRVRGNKGARTAGADGQTVYYVETVRGVEGFLDELRSQLKDRPGRTHRKTRRCAAMFRVLGDSTDPAGSRATRRLLLLPNQKRLPVL